MNTVSLSALKLELGEFWYSLALLTSVEETSRATLRKLARRRPSGESRYRRQRREMKTTSGQQPSELYDLA
ncbi:MAG: hypothetical protein ACLU99_13390 [Alphaproteobacteria bacterium]